MKKHEIEPTEFKFGTYGAIDLKPCKARTKLLKWCDLKRDDHPVKPIKIIIEAEFDGGVQSGFDGVGQEFTIKIGKVKFK